MSNDYEKGRLNLPFVGICTFGKYPYISDWDDLDADFNHNFHYGGFLADVEIPIDKMRLFLERHNADFDKIAVECIKKIQY